MITKEQAQGVLKAVNPVIYEGDELTRQLAETVIALHERVEQSLEFLRLVEARDGKLFPDQWMKLHSFLKETDHD